METRPRPSSIEQRVDVPQWRHVCERCGEPMEERQCKIVCRNCGAYRDCSDP